MEKNNTSLIRRIWNRIYRVEHGDCVSITVTKNLEGEHSTYEEHLRVEDTLKLRQARVRDEVNDVGFALLDNPKSGVVSFTSSYRRQTTYLFGRIHKDEATLENIIKYKDGRTEVKEVEY